MDRGAEMSVRRPLRRVPVVVALGLLAAAAPAAAELYRCQGPDGKTLFTDNKALCPGADAFEPSGELQTAPARPAPAPAGGGDARLDRAEARRLSEEAERSEAARWRRMREEAERKIAAVAERREYLDQFVTACNRGRNVITRDDVGIKRTMSCDAIREEYASMDDEEAKLRNYLEQELPEACRRAGCLPGWLRD